MTVFLIQPLRRNIKPCSLQDYLTDEHLTPHKEKECLCIVRTWIHPIIPWRLHCGDCLGSGFNTVISLKHLLFDDNVLLQVILFWVLTAIFKGYHSSQRTLNTRHEPFCRSKGTKCGASFPKELPTLTGKEIRNVACLIDKGMWQLDAWFTTATAVLVLALEAQACFG